MSAADTGFDADRLLERLTRLPASSRFIVGFSGGADSTALLTALHELGERRAAALEALHFNHGLHPDADEWQRHCEEFCAARRIPCRTQRLDIRVADGASPETAARAARYEALRRLLEPEDLFLTAHQADDRAETLMLNLVRGSGIDGLASIPPLRELGKGRVARPLLDFRRRDLERFLAARAIGWIDDPTNLDTGLDRNFLRHEILPELESRWPGAVSRLANTAAQVRQTVDVLAENLEFRFAPLLVDAWTLPLPALLEQPAFLQGLLLRHWIRTRGIPPPPATRLCELLDQLQRADAATQPEMRWAGWQIKRHRSKLWLHRDAFPAICPERRWPGRHALSLGEDFGTLVLEPPDSVPGGLLVGPRQHGTSMQLHDGGPRRPLKDLLRESGIPPWLRTAVPVLYRDDEPLAVGDWQFSADWQAWLSAHRATFRWEPGDGLLQRLRTEAQAAMIDRSAPLR